MNKLQKPIAPSCSDSSQDITTDKRLFLEDGSLDPSEHEGVCDSENMTLKNQQGHILGITMARMV